ISNFGVSLNKGEILFDTTGQIIKGMAKSKCVQLSKGIVMDDVSSVTSKPILLIDEYDVVANHGASIGKMSDESLFYLMSRGLTRQEAFLLILEGIVYPFIEKITDEKLKLSVNEKIEQLMKR
ncbi:MAG: SufD family Fe-S cluster assembly protein, partial [Anaeroplasmataceae bacterium]|nr:SufD family Fe-S cluster assembly protein [Anaeroplasmataceae bacterium]